MRDTPRRPRSLGAISAGEPRVQAVEVEEDDRGRVEGQRLADDQPADDRITERLADFGARARAEHQRNAAEQGRHRRPHERPEAQLTGLADSTRRTEAATALRLEREVYGD